MSFPPYPSYRDSGIGWLAEVPTHWDVTRLKNTCEVFPSNVDKKTVKGQLGIHLCNYTDVYYNDKIVEGMSFMEASATDEQVERFQLRAGDTIFTKDSETPDDIARSAYVPADLPGVICGYHLSMVRPNTGTFGPFIKRYFDASTTRAYFHVKANGLTRVGLGQYAVDNAPIALPSLDEQIAIAVFLDRETAKIDTLLDEQRRLIELLKEKRQAVISHTVNKGLDPTVPMKDSGVKWLGNVPAHWQVKRLKHLSPAITVGIVVNPSTYTSAEGLPFIFGGDISPGVVHVDGARRITPELSASQPKTILRAGDLVTVRVGAPGITAVVPPECEGGNCASVMLVRKGTHPSAWLCYVMNSAQTKFQVELVQYGAAQEQFNISHAVNFVVITPPVGEAELIVSMLDAHVANIDSLSAEAQAATTLLRERRAALISAAVTGKIDVRSAAPQQAQAA